MAAMTRDDAEQRLRSWSTAGRSCFSDATIWWDGQPPPLYDRNVDASRLVAAFACDRALVPGLRLSLCDCDEVLIGRGAARLWSCENREVVTAFPARTMSRLHARLSRSNRGWSLTDVGSKNGSHVDGQPVAHHELTDGDLVELGAVFFVYREAPGSVGRPTSPDHRDLAAEQDVPEGLRTLSLDLEKHETELIRVAPTPDPVLIEGEAGTGKELIARAVHEKSERTGPFVRVPCRKVATIADAAARAHGGTLFLDDVDKLGGRPQVELCRLLHEPAGLDVRVIASTRLDGQVLLARGFRRDVYVRLAGHHVVIPPLRDRREDIGSIAAALFRRIAPGRTELRVDRLAAYALMTYAYPLNVRELENALRDAIGLASEDEILLEHLPPAMRAGVPPH
jgi:hypothetical protein